MLVKHEHRRIGNLRILMWGMGEPQPFIRELQQLGVDAGKRTHRHSAYSRPLPTSDIRKSTIGYSTQATLIQRPI